MMAAAARAQRADDADAWRRPRARAYHGPGKTDQDTRAPCQNHDFA
eukprot:SAG31_NODE_21357_length_551_cov_2.433628_1_plen_45_part_10